MASQGLFSSSIYSSRPEAIWNQIDGSLDMDGDPLPAPTPRGGHAMCFDRIEGRIYLFGGYDGKKSLDDFWVFNIQDHSWKLIPPRLNFGDPPPSPRACHKMVFDDSTGDIYLLGSLDDTSSPELPNDPHGLPPPTVHVSTVTGMTPRGSASSREGSPVNIVIHSPPPPGSISRSGSAGSPSTRGLTSELYRYRTRGPDSGKWEVVSYDTSVSLELLSIFSGHSPSLTLVWLGTRRSESRVRPSDGHR